MFSMTSVMRFVLCIVTSHVLTVTDENQELCIFPILPVKRFLCDSADISRRCHSMSREQLKAGFFSNQVK